jgi:hypothetical protein
MSNNIQTIQLDGFSLDSTEDDKTSSDPTSFTNEKKDQNLVKKEMRKSVINSEDYVEEQKEKQEYILLLSRYGQSKRFAEYLNSLKFNLSVSTLKKMDIGELKAELERVRCSINNKSVSEFWTEMVLGILQTGEMIVVNTKLNKKFKISGLTEALKQDNEFMDLLEQIELENTQFSITNPYVRLGYTIISAAMKTSAVNTLLDRMDAAGGEGIKITPLPDETNLETEKKEEVETEETGEVKKEEPKDNVLDFQ